MKTLYLRLLAIALLCVLLAGCTPAPQQSGTTAPSLSESCTHADENSDGLCDICSGSVEVQLDFFAINDIHGKFCDSDSQPGVDELTSYLSAQGKNAILLSSGDTWQGSAESNLTQGMLLTEWMNELGFVSMTLGNHEFDWGTDYIQANAEIAEFPFLAINIYSRDTNALAEFCQPSVTVERGGVTVGIIGAIGDCYSSISGDKSGDIYFKTGSDLTALVKEEAQRLRNAGADIIVYSIHDGSENGLNGRDQVTESQMGSYYDTELSNGYVDLVFEGHIHKRYAFTDEYGVYHLQAGGENTGISHAEVVYNIITESISYVQGSIVDSSTYDDSPADPLVQTLLDKYAEQISQAGEVLGENGRYQEGDQLRQLVSQLYYEAGVERWGKEYDIVLGGGFISVRNPYNLPAGQVTYGDLQSLFPFDNRLVLCSLDGKTLRDKFFETDNGNYFIYYEDYGTQVLANLDPNGTYYIITDSYSSSYKPNRLTVVAEYDEGVYARDLLADYIRDGGMAPPSADELELTDIPTILETGAALAPGALSKDSYMVQGTIVSIASTKYGNVTIADGNGNELYIYGMYDANGKRYENMESQPQVGDTVVLYGQIQHYVSPYGDVIIELVHTTLMPTA